MKLLCINLRHILRVVEVFLLVSFISIGHARNTTSCSCGYIDDQGHLWREAIVTEFTNTSDILDVLGDDWDRSEDTEPQPAPATANIQYIQTNVLKHNSALGIQATAHTSGSSSVDSGEIFTQRSDILYGTFRMRAAVPSVPGVVFGFFSYESDTQEQDIEFLSSDSKSHQHVQYTNQPGTVNGQVDEEAYRDVEIDAANFTTLGEHRFDWLKTATKYYYNSNLTATINKNVATSASEIVVNVWSNGDPEFSQGPPTSNAIATVEYIKLYFNSTSLSEAKFHEACSGAGKVARCAV
ncbi:concanavalin A-like lectin/glucanase domain-containing protein [Lentinula aciculospora]|uniref:Concanavalin A-like lectin/glucanase domain-containing protein n=1 Tax=Lentinula aciculospora TaxID=153920 RepID=A0A9W9A7Q4_9AGAR|nr:concanavalin A-like lectin/glucanase domain-containing protein [Lentinula aciculospora]